jgi:ribonuclease HI
MSSEKLSMVAYCDGSCKPNPGYSGYGVYAYTYDDKSVKNPIKHPVHEKFKYTNIGFEEEKGKIVNVVDVYEVIDAIIGENFTNNHAELLAYKRVLKIANSDDRINNLLIYTDSTYVCNSINTDINNWILNGWKRVDGKEIIHKEIWLSIIDEVNKFRAKGGTLQTKWIKGHDNNIGNAYSDLFSNIASNASYLLRNDNHERGSIVTIYDKKSPFSAYKNSYKFKDIIYNFKDVFFSSDNIDDKTYCFLYNASKKEEDIGVRTTESIFAINIGYVPEIINKIKAYHRSIPRFNHQPCNIKISKFKNPLYLKLFHEVDIRYLLVQDGNKPSFTLVRDHTPFVYDVARYAPLIMNVSEMFNDIFYISSSDIENKIIIDVTDKFYNKNKLILTNKDDSIEFDEEVNSIIKKLYPNDNVLLQKLKLIIGVDMPDYLTLKSMEREVKKVNLICYLDIPSSTMTILFNFELSNRNLLITNIANKFVIKTLLKGK